MLRHRRFLQVMHRLALMGALLMAVAPVVSRWMQAHPGGDPLHQLAALCTSHGLQQADLASATVAVHAAHAGTAMAMTMDMPMLGMNAGDADGMPADHHDGMACEYCVLAGNLLPFLLVLLVLPLLQHTAMRPQAFRPLPRRALAWPAHGARGPPGVFLA
jgi:hypothetical protein